MAKLKLPGGTLYDPEPIMTGRKPSAHYESRIGQRTIMMVEEDGITQATEVTDSDQHERCLKVVNQAKGQGRTLKVVYYIVRGGVLRRVRRGELKPLSIPTMVAEKEISPTAASEPSDASPALAIAS